ncbi:MAG TPA: peroxidase family protein, partial [Propionibacteriaceae bacterium]|nr:peroxidase family protein [Propionibacteriaceae bacterium]
MPHGDADHGVITPSSTFYDQGRFGRLFPTLPPFASDTPLVRAALTELGRPGGLMDADDDLTDPIALITNPALSSNNADNPRLSAGMTFLGQFLDHDMTFDPTSSLARAQDPESIRNFRIPALDLDSVYGGGPGVSPHLYNRNVDAGRTTLLVETNPGSETAAIDGQIRSDVPRNSQVIALIGDPRNDENLIVSQLHLAVVRFHNHVVGDVRNDLGPLATTAEVFSEAQRVVRWHYQWMILHEFLPLTCGDDVVESILTDGRQFYDWHNDPF